MARSSARFVRSSIALLLAAGALAACDRAGLESVVLAEASPMILDGMSGPAVPQRAFPGGIRSVDGDSPAPVMPPMAGTDAPLSAGPFVQRQLIKGAEFAEVVRIDLEWRGLPANLDPHRITVQNGGEYIEGLLVRDGELRFYTLNDPGHLVDVEFLIRLPDREVILPVKINSLPVKPEGAEDAEDEAEAEVETETETETETEVSGPDAGAAAGMAGEAATEAGPVQGMENPAQEGTAAEPAAGMAAPMAAGIRPAADSRAGEPVPASAFSARFARRPMLAMLMAESLSMARAPLHAGEGEGKARRGGEDGAMRDGAGAVQQEGGIMRVSTHGASVSSVTAPGPDMPETHLSRAGPGLPAEAVSSGETLPSAEVAPSAGAVPSAEAAPSADGPAPATASLSGAFIGEDGLGVTSLAGRRVSVSGPFNNVRIVATVDALGRFYVGHLPVGTYDVSLLDSHRPGFLTVLLKVHEGSRHVSMTIPFEARARERTRRPSGRTYRTDWRKQQPVVEQDGREQEQQETGAASAPVAAVVEGVLAP